MRATLFSLLLLATPALAGYPGAPASVTAGYIEADGAGKALDSDTCQQVLKFTTWPDAPGWDTFVVIKSYEIGAVGTNPKKASVDITYEVLGELSAFHFIAKPAQEEVSFALVKRKDKWKIISPQLPPHLTVPTAIAFLEKIGAKDDAEGRAVLKKLHALE